MQVVGIVLTLGVVAFVLFCIFSGIATFITEGIPAAYRELRYERKGICSVCKQPFTEVTAKRADQMYGPPVITQKVCPHGHKSIPAGNRHFADW